MNYYTAVEIAFFNYSAGIPVVVEYDLCGGDLVVQTIRLKHPKDGWFQPEIDSIKCLLNYESLIPAIMRDLLEREKEEIAASHFDDLNEED